MKMRTHAFAGMTSALRAPQCGQVIVVVPDKFRELPHLAVRVACATRLPRRRVTPHEWTFMGSTDRARYMGSNRDNRITHEYQE
jgi:hypothetical protein